MELSIVERARRTLISRLSSAFFLIQEAAKLVNLKVKANSVFARTIRVTGPDISAITETAEILKGSFLRESDELGRLGGDEFAALVLDVAESGTAVVKGRLLEKLRERSAASKNNFEIAFSVGILCCRFDESRSLDHLLSDADALMYQEKNLKHAPELRGNRESAQNVT